MQPWIEQLKKLVCGASFIGLGIYFNKDFPNGGMGFFIIIGIGLIVWWCFE